MYRFLPLLLFLPGLVFARQPEASTAHADAARAPYSVEGGLFWAKRASKAHPLSRSMLGTDASFVYRVSPYHAFTLGVGGGMGGEDVRYNPRGVYDEHPTHAWSTVDSITRQDYTLMLGYRCTLPFSRSFTMALDAGAGLDVQRVEVQNSLWYSLFDNPEPKLEYSAKGTSAGFGYAAGLRFDFHFNSHVSLTAGYRFHGATTKPVAKGREKAFRCHSESMRWHEFRIGSEYRF